MKKHYITPALSIDSIRMYVILGTSGNDTSITTNGTGDNGGPPSSGRAPRRSVF